jgi:hypothetical protein
VNSGEGVNSQEGYEVFTAKGFGSTNPLEKQQMSTNPSVGPVLFIQWSKGCFVRPSINQRVFQKVAYICVVPSHTFALKTKAYVCTKNRNVRQLDLSYVRSKSLNASLVSLVTQSPN